MTRELVDRFNLRNTYSVYKDGDVYSVVGENRRGQSYECRVRREAVSYVRDRMAGRRVTAEQAGQALSPVAERFELPYTYGDKLRYSGQYVLIAVVALGHATVAKEGRAYVYSIK